MASVGSAQVGFACPKFPGRVRRYHWGFGDSAKATTHMSLHSYRVEFFETASQIPNGLWDACFQPPAKGCAHRAIVRGWAEPHYLGSQGLMPAGTVVVYTPKDVEELAICTVLFSKID